MEKKSETFRAKLWRSSAKKHLELFERGYIHSIFSVVVASAKLFVSGLDFAMNYVQDFFVSFVLAGGLFSIGVFIANFIFRAPYLVGQGLVTENENFKGLLESKELPLLVEPRGSSAQTVGKGLLDFQQDGNLHSSVVLRCSDF